MLHKLLNESLASALTHLEYDLVYELRLRINSPAVVNYGGRFVYLSTAGVTDDADRAIVCDKKTVENIVYRASDYSLYAYNNQLKASFITIGGGVRIGICGEIVTDGDKIKTVKNFSSVTVRIPHNVPDCAAQAFPFMVDTDIHNCLVVSPPGGGKTTFLRDFSRLVSTKLTSPVNTLLLDERSELAACSGGVPQLDVGKNTDVITNCTKLYGFRQGIRAMRPDLVITDELVGDEDLEAIEYAVLCGVRVVASVHAFDQLDLCNKEEFSKLVKKSLFDRYIVLSDRRGPGTYEGIYDKNFEQLYFPVTQKQKRA